MRALIPTVLLGVLLATAPATASAQQVTLSASTWLAGPGASGLPTLSGTVDQPTSSSVISGWVVDTTAQGWSGIDDVQIWNGFMDAGGQLVSRPLIQQNRPDVAATLNNPYWAASGYAGTLQNAAQTGALYVYAHTPARGWWYQQVLISSPVLSIAAGPRLDIEMPTPLATVHHNAPYTMRGTAYDPTASPDQGTGVDRVQVYLNGDRSSGILIGDAQLGLYDKFSAAAGPQFANAGWQLTFQTNSWLGADVSDNTITPMTVYAHSSVTGQETQSQVSIVISVP